MIKRGRKLKNTRGASIIMALVTVLVLTMVSVIIIAAASANAGRLRRNQAEQQAYLTVSSAAQLMRESVAGKSYSVSVTTTTGSDGKKTSVTNTSPVTGAFSGMLNAAALGTAGQSFTISVQNLQDVSVTVTNDPSGYGLTAQLCLAGNPQSNSYLRLKCPAQESNSTSGDNNSSTATHTITWQAGEITKGAES